MSRLLLLLLLLLLQLLLLSVLFGCDNHQDAGFNIPLYAT